MASAWPEPRLYVERTPERVYVSEAVAGVPLGHFELIAGPGWVFRAEFDGIRAGELRPWQILPMT